MRLIILHALVLFCSALTAGQDLSKIKLLESTCDDVKRIMGVDKCDLPSSEYELKDERVTIDFSMCPCPTRCYHLSGGWNVPPGTVLSIERRFRPYDGLFGRPRPISEFVVDSRQWVKEETDFIGEAIYENKQDGITIRTLNGEVNSITYTPAIEKNKPLLCKKCNFDNPKSRKTQVPSFWFAAYDGAKIGTETQRLDDFARILQKEGSAMRGYVIAYVGCASKKAEAFKEIQRVKHYLIQNQGLTNSSIRLMNGGQREVPLVELHIRARNLAPPRINSSVYPSGH